MSQVQAKIFARLVFKGAMSMEKVPEDLKKDVKAILEQLDAD